MDIDQEIKFSQENPEAFSGVGELVKEVTTPLMEADTSYPRLCCAYCKEMKNPTEVERDLEHEIICHDCKDHYNGKHN